jgi:hypothetical protein
MFEPTTLPKAMPGEPAKAAFKLVINSGVEVPKPTKVRPISISDTCSRRARPTAPRTRISPPIVSKPRPPINNNNVCNVSPRASADGAANTAAEGHRKNKSAPIRPPPLLLHCHDFAVAT